MLAKYENGVKQRMDEYNKGTTRQKYAANEEYVKFKQGIYVRRLYQLTSSVDVRHSGGAESWTSDPSYQRACSKRFVVEAYSTI